MNMVICNASAAVLLKARRSRPILGLRMRNPWDSTDRDEPAVRPKDGMTLGSLVIVHYEQNGPDCQEEDYASR